MSIISRNLSRSSSLEASAFSESTPSLSTGQMQIDSMVENFSRQASDPLAILSMSAAGLAGKIARAGILSAFSSRGGNYALQLLSHLGSVGVEAATLESIHRASNLSSNPESFFRSWETQFINFATFRAVSHLNSSQNILAQQFTQSAAMVSGHQVASILGFEEKSHLSLREQFLHASVETFQMQVGNSLNGIFFGHRFSLFERQLEFTAHTQGRSQPQTQTANALTRNPVMMNSAERTEVSSNGRRKSLRTYQREANESITNHFQAGNDRALVVLPTGTGKTVTFAHLAASFLGNGEGFPNRTSQNKRVLIVSHREEIIYQNAQEIAQQIGEENVGVYQSGFWDAAGKHQIKNINDRQVVIASAQSLIHDHLNLSDFGLVILDEAHHYVYGNEWFNPLIQMGFFDAKGNITLNESCYLAGFTATPDRLTGPALNKTFGKNGLVYQRDITWMIENGYLLNPYGIEINLRLHNDDAEDPRESFQKTKTANRSEWIANIFNNRLREDDRFMRTILFTGSKEDVEIHTAHLNTEAIRTLGLTADSIWIPDGSSLRKVQNAEVAKARTEELGHFRKGKYVCLANINIATEGFDDPGTEVIIIDRMTESRALLAQMIGRALRSDPENPHRTRTLIFDLAGNLRRLQLGINIEEIYSAEKVSGHSHSVLNDGRTSSPSVVPNHEAFGIDLRSLGSIVDAHRTNHFSKIVNHLLTSPEAIQQAAYEMGIHSDIIFNYANSQHLPEYEEVLRLAEATGDTSGVLLDAWAWDHVEEMDHAHPLSAELLPHNRGLTRQARWGLWRKLEGDISKLSNNQNAPIRQFILHGKLMAENMNYSLDDFYTEISMLAAGEWHKERVDALQDLIHHTIFEQRNWSDNAKTAHENLLLALRRRVAAPRLRGSLPHDLSAALGLKANSLPNQRNVSALTQFLLGKKISLGGKGGVITPQEFYNDLKLLLETLGHDVTETNKLIRKAIFEEKVWNLERQGFIEELRFRMREVVADHPQLRGILPVLISKALNLNESTGLLPKQENDSPLNRYLKGETVEYTRSFGAEEFYRQIRILLVQGGINDQKVETLIQAAIFEHERWSLNANTPMERLRLRLRQAVSQDPRLRSYLPHNLSAVLGLGTEEDLPSQGKGSVLTQFLEGTALNFGRTLPPHKFRRQIRLLLINLGISGNEADELIRHAVP